MSIANGVGNSVIFDITTLIAANVDTTMDILNQSGGFLLNQGGGKILAQGSAPAYFIGMDFTFKENSQYLPLMTV